MINSLSNCIMFLNIVYIKESQIPRQLEISLITSQNMKKHTFSEHTGYLLALTLDFFMYGYFLFIIKF